MDSTIHSNRHTIIHAIQSIITYKETICSISTIMLHLMYILPIIVVAVATLHYKNQTRLAHVISWAVGTSYLTADMPLIASILLAILWNLILLAVALITTFMPQTHKKGMLCAAVCGAILPNLFAHPLHVHPVRLLLRILITYGLPNDYVWYLITPEWFIFVVIWKMLRHHYMIHPPTSIPPPKTMTHELV